MRTRAHGAELAARGVEGRHRGIRSGPPPEGVEGAAVAVVAHARGPGPLAVEGGLPEAVGLRRVDRRTAHLVAQQAAQGQGLVADHLRLEAIPGRPCQEPVPRVFRLQLGPDLRRLAIRRRGDDQAEQGLRVPARAHVLAGQPVEQLGMARRLALGAEVLLGLDQADAEQLRPEPVDGDARGQRIAGIDEPAPAPGGRAVPLPAAGGTRPARRARPWGQGRGSSPCASGGSRAACRRAALP